MNFELIKKGILHLVSRASQTCEESGIQVVLHFVDHSEYEIALESIGRAAMKSGVMSEEDFWLYVDVAKQLKLDNDEVATTDFWIDLLEYGGRLGFKLYVPN